MYEDSQRFSEGEEEEDSRVITINPHLLANARGGRLMHGRDDIEPVDSTAFTMQRVVDRDTRSPLMGGDGVVDTPEYANIREESMQRILNRLSPNGRRAFLRTMSEGEGEVRPPDPFTIPDSNDEYEPSEGMDRLDTRSEIDYLLDLPIPELTTRSLISISTNEAIQSHISAEVNPNVTVRVSKPKVSSCQVTKESDVLRQFGPPRDSMEDRMSEPYIPNDDLEQLNYGRPKAFTPTEQARARVTKNLFPSTRDDDLNLGNISENRWGVKVNTTMGDRIENVNTTSTTWIHRHPRSTVVHPDSHQPIISSRIAGPDQTYPKLLPAVELFSPLPISLRSTMAYPARTGAGYRVNKPDGTYEYQYFESIPTEPRENPIIERMGGEALYTGHGIFSDQRHADPLFGGGVGCVNFPRTQREIAHQTGPPKFCGNSGAGRETYSLNRGADFTHAPARLSATEL